MKRVGAFDHLDVSGIDLWLVNDVSGQHMGNQPPAEAA
jgi:hypothetical protein